MRISYEKKEAGSASSADGTERRESPPCHPARRSVERPEAGRQGFSSCGHRLASLYRGANQTASTLTQDYRVRSSSRSKYAYPTAETGAGLRSQARPCCRPAGPSAARPRPGAVRASAPQNLRSHGRPAFRSRPRHSAPAHNRAAGAVRRGTGTRSSDRCRAKRQLPTPARLGQTRHDRPAVGKIGAGRIDAGHIDRHLRLHPVGEAGRVKALPANRACRMSSATTPTRSTGPRGRESRP